MSPPVSTGIRNQLIENHLLVSHYDTAKEDDMRPGKTFGSLCSQGLPLWSELPLFDDVDGTYRSPSDSVFQRLTSARLGTALARLCLQEKS